MLVKSMKTHFAARSLEWFGAGVMGSWGYYVTTHPQLFTDDATKVLFSGLVKVAEFFGQPPVMLGVLALLVGVVRGGALFINGAYRKTPLIRLLTAFASAYIWTSVVFGYSLVEATNTGLVVYSWFVVADIISGYRAGYDLVIAEKAARQAGSIHGQRNTPERRGYRKRVWQLVFPSHP